MDFAFYAVALAAIAGAGAYLYVHFIASRMTRAAVATDKAATVAAVPGPAKLWAMLEGWKTNALAWIAAIVALVAQLPAIISAVLGSVDADLLRAWQSAPWSSVIDAKVANWITLGITLVIPLTHAAGLSRAAQITPAPPTAPPRG